MLGIKDNMVSGYARLIVELMFYALESGFLDYLCITIALLERKKGE